MIYKILIDKEGYKIYVHDLKQDIHTNFGLIKAKDFKKKKLKTNIGKVFYVYDPLFYDLYMKKKRNAQIMLKKDIGLIITECGLNKDSVVVEAGGGSGALGCFLANMVKKVTSYEVKEDFVKTIKKNIKLMDLKNITLKNKDVSKMTEKKLDLISLDLVNPEKYIEKCFKSLRKGGFLVVYLPSITQVVTLVKKVKEIEDAIYNKTVELIERKWKIDGKIARPEFRMLGHTGFLSFFRRL